IRILSQNFADSLHEPFIVACLEVGRRGDDTALYSLIAIDEGRKVVNRESEIITGTLSRGASMEQIYQIRKKRATKERIKEIHTAMQQVSAGQAYCVSLLEKINRGGM